MKLGMFLLIFGLVLAGGGVAMWMYADPNVSLWFGGRFSVDEAQMLEAGDIGLTILGGGLALGGIVRMIVAR